MARLWKSGILCASGVVLLLAPGLVAAGINGVATAPDGSIVLVAALSSAPDGPGAVYRLDPRTGQLTVVSSGSSGSGPVLVYPVDVAVEADGSLVVTDFADLVAGSAHSNRLMRVDPATGARTIVADAGRGAGPLLSGPRGIAVGTDGTLFVTNGSGRPAVIRVDPTTGDRADASTGTGPAFAAPYGIVTESDGRLAVTESGRAGAVLRLDPLTGDRSVVSDDESGAGPPLRQLRGVDVQGDGGLVVADQGHTLFCGGATPFGFCLRRDAALMRVDPLTGDRRVLSGGGTALSVWLGNFFDGRVTPWFGRVGTGPGFGSPTGVARETDGSVLVADGDSARPVVVRVDVATGRRAVATRLDNPGSGQTQETGPRSTRATRRMLEAWMGSRAAERLYASLWKTMRETLGDEHPDTLQATDGMAALAASRGERSRARDLFGRLAAAGWAVPPDSGRPGKVR